VHLFHRGKKPGMSNEWVGAQAEGAKIYSTGNTHSGEFPKTGRLWLVSRQPSVTRTGTLDKEKGGMRKTHSCARSRPVEKRGQGIGDNSTIPPKFALESQAAGATRRDK